MTVLASKASRAGAGRQGRRRSGLRRVADGLVVLALAVIALALAAAVVPRLAGFDGLAITSGSMGKAAPTGSLVLTRDRLASEVETGDVIAVERPGHPIVVHRVISVEATTGTPVVETKGDANATPDPEPYPLPVRVPVMARALPFVGYLVALLQVPLGWLLLIALPATAVAAAVIRDLWRTEEDELAPVTTAVAGDLQPALDATRAELATLRERSGLALVNLKHQLDAARAEAAELRGTLAAAQGFEARPEPASDPRLPELGGLLAEARGESAALRERLRSAEAELRKALAPDPRLPELERLLGDARGELVSLRSALAAAAAVAERATAPDPRLPALERALREAEGEVTALRAALAGAETAASRPDPRVPELEQLLARTTAESVELAERLAELQAAVARPVAAEAQPGPSVLYVATPTGYRVVERDDAPPPAGSRIVLDGSVFVVARVGSSPFPRDRRRCAFVLPG